MSTPSETKFVAFLRKLQGGSLDSEPLSYIAKIYDDSPRKDLNADSQFPRVQVKELGGNSKLGGFNDTTKIYNITLDLTVYVDMDTPFDYTDAKIAAFWTAGRNMSPEEAAGAIVYHIAKEVCENHSTLASDNSYKFVLMGNSSFVDKGIDNTYFNNLNVYKAGMTFDFKLRY